MRSERLLILTCALLGAAASLPGLVGCASSPAVQFIRLEPVKPRHNTPEVSAPPVMVGRIHLPPALDRDELVFRSGGHTLEVHSTVRWAAPLDKLVRRTLAMNLASRLSQEKVVLPDSPAPPGPSRVFMVTFERFSAGPSGRVVLKAYWSLHETDSQKKLLERSSRITVDAGSTEGPDIAAAMSVALARLAGSMADSLNPAERQD